MNLKWNEVTWYSKLFALIFFIAIFPTITFCIGREYQKTIDSLNGYSTEESIRTPIAAANTSSGSASEQKSYSGIRGTAPEQAIISVMSEDEMVSQTTPNEDGGFIVFLPPGEYTVSDDTHNEEVKITVTQGSMVSLALGAKSTQ